MSMVHRRRRAGTALVEFALVCPVLLLLIAGVLDYCRALSKATAVANAARIGAQYGSASTTNAADTSGIQSAVVNSAPDFTGLAVTSSRTCQCPNGSSVSCTGSCGASNLEMYVQVTVTSTAAAIFNYTGLPYTGAVSATAAMRVQ